MGAGVGAARQMVNIANVNVDKQKVSLVFLFVFLLTFGDAVWGRRSLLAPLFVGSFPALNRRQIGFESPREGFESAWGARGSNT